MHDRKTESKETFDRLAPRYDRHFYGSHGRRQYQRVIAASSAWHFASVLDVGCGTGNLLSLFRGRNITLAGSDLSPGMVAEAVRRLGGDADVRVADSESLPWDAGSFDLVVSTDSFHHYPRPLQALSEMRRVLRRNGHLVLADVWAPFPIRQLGNLAARFGRDGDVRVYSDMELTLMMRETGFEEIKRVANTFSAIVMAAAVHK